MDELLILKKGKSTSKPNVEPPLNEGLLDIAICGDCNMQDPDNGVVPHSNECGDCKVNFENLTQPSRLLLHYHNKLDHISFKSLKDLARVGFLPKCLVRANYVVCAACQSVKSHIKPASKTGKIIKGKIRNPGVLIHMDQAQSSTAERSLRYSGNNKKRKYSM